MKKVLGALAFVWKNNKVWLIVTASVMTFVFTATMIATQHVFLRNTLNTVLGAERRVLVKGDPSKYQYYTADGDDFLTYEPITELKSKDDALEDANNLNEKIVEEGIVLIKNEANALPIPKGSKVSVFGKNSVNLVYGGSGSGGGNTQGAATIYDSLQNAGINYNPALKSFYESKSSGSGRSKNPDMGSIPMGLATGETPMSRYTDAIKATYADYKDAAIVVISRIGGEGFDLPRTMLNENGRPISGARADDHYLQLDNNERSLLNTVSTNFDKVILVINCSTSMELGFLDDGSYNNRIKAALWIGSPGKTGVNALGRIMTGEVNPSGRLVDTYARNFKNDPTWANFSNNLKTDGNRYTLAGSGANAYFVEYEEGIYVGYRYYETRAFDELYNYGNEEWYSENVVFPFGYGLSYTTFDWEITDVSENELSKDGEIRIEVAVKNTGSVAGKDVVQLYYSAPYYDGIEKPHVVLGDFAKTAVIEPNKTDTVTLSLKVSDMASYDYNDANGNDFYGYEVEDGIYTVYIGKNAHQAWDEDNELHVDFSVPPVDGGFKYETDPVTDYAVENRFDDVSNYITTYLSRKDFEFTAPVAPTDEEREVKAAFIDSLLFSINDEEQPYYTDVMPTQGVKPEDGVYRQLYELINWNKETGEVSVDYDDPLWDTILDYLTVEEMAYLIGTGNFNTDYIERIGKPKTTDPDGPAGFTNFMGDPTVYGTCFYASECVIGATWNKDLVHDMGVMVGIEGIYGNVKGDKRPYSGWYAPAVNIHRSPFAGRNFEYYSEDGFLSGIMGASVVAGANKKGVYTYVKHFALNDQETNRDTNGLITWASEQSMREIYFRAFEIIVKVGETKAIMSSFNRIGTVWAGGSYELLTEVLRNEWGFRGMVISDYNLYDHMPADQMIRAGGDLNLTQDDRPTLTPSALSATQVSSMRQAVKNILYTVASSNAMNGMGEGVVYRYAMPLWMLLLVWFNILLLIGFSVWGFFSIRKSIKRIKPQSKS